MGSKGRAYFKVDRDLVSSEIWLSEPFTRAQAWIDLIGAARYAEDSTSVPVTRQGRASIVTLRRGELCPSIKYLQNRWIRSHSWVRSTLQVFLDAGWIDMNTTDGVRIITIRNYDTYQDSTSVSGKSAGRASGVSGKSAGRAQNVRGSSVDRDERSNYNVPPTECPF